MLLYNTPAGPVVERDGACFAVQRAWQDGGRGSYWTTLAEAEAAGPRWVGQTGRIIF